MFILARWRAPSDRWSGHRQRQRHPRDLVGIKRDYVTWRREIVEPDLTSWFRGIVALTLNKCKPRSLSQIETHRRSILFTGQWLQTSFWHVPRQQARLLRRLHWVLPRKDAKGTCQMLLDGTDIISVSPPSLKKKVYVEAGSGYSTNSYLTSCGIWSESFKRWGGKTWPMKPSLHVCVIRYAEVLHAAADQTKAWRFAVRNSAAVLGVLWKIFQNLSAA